MSRFPFFARSKFVNRGPVVSPLTSSHAWRALRVASGMLKTCLDVLPLPLTARVARSMSTSSTSSDATPRI